jgi:DNA-binding MarR family transcriptional regulator
MRGADMATELYKFTPSLEDPKALQELLIGREALVRRLLQAIEEAGKGGSIQHFLLLGPRGIGKTHLLLLLHNGVKGTIHWDREFRDLPKRWESILFSEEQYSIGSLMELLIGILERLQDQSPMPETERLLARLREIWMPGEAERESLIDYLVRRREETGKRYLLLLDNVHMILEALSEEDQGRLREILMSQDLFMIIGSAPTLFQAVFDYEAPFYNFFEVIWLKELTVEKVEELLKKRMERDGHRDLLEKLQQPQYRGKLQAMIHLTGGNPRLTLSLYQILSRGEILEVERGLLRIFDELTPYFQERMNALSPQQRKIIEMLALMKGPSTPTEIARATHLRVNVVTSQLDRLREQGYIRRLAGEGKRETLYDISEQLFRLWRMMRVEAGRRRLHFLMKFIEIWYAEARRDERQALASFRKAFLHLKDTTQEPDLELAGNLLNMLLRAKEIPLTEEALELLEAQEPDWGEFLRPYREAIRFLKTKKRSILNRLFPEVREIVEQIVAQVEKAEETETARPKPKTRSKSQRKRKT